ncbi:MAG: hypothetical protein L0G27_06545 [Paracoccus sp. (in: a-proteobacteria)]|nr:hypothetical protein [Paracoccus sp. (in: a-proteobacteria)]
MVLTGWSDNVPASPHDVPNVASSGPEHTALAVISATPQASGGLPVTRVAIIDFRTTASQLDHGT